MVSSIGTGVPKAIGILAGALITHEAFKAGTKLGYGDTDVQTADEICDVFIKHQSSSINSEALESLKSSRRVQLLDDRLVEHFRRIKNVATSITSQMVGYSLPLGLCVGAVALPGVFGGLCAAGLILGGAKILLTDVVGIGKK